MNLKKEHQLYPRFRNRESFIVAFQKRSASLEEKERKSKKMGGTPTAAKKNFKGRKD